MKKSFIFPALALLLSSGITLLFSEVLTRLMAPAWLEQRMLVLNPTSSATEFGTDREWKVERKNGVFWKFTPGTHFDVAHYEYNVKAHIDALGGRAILRPNSESDPRLDVLPFLGDSFTFGIGVRDSETFAAILSPLASKKRVLNLGVPGSALNNHLDIIELRHEELGRPNKYILFFFLGNDFSDLISAKNKRSGVKQSFDAGGRAAFNSIIQNANDFVYHNLILKRSYLLQFVRHFALSRINAQSANEFMDPVFIIMARDNERYQREAEAALHEQLDRLSMLQTRLGFKSLFVAIPSMYQTNTSLRKIRELEYGLREDNIDPNVPNKILRDQLQKYDLDFIDATFCLAQNNSDSSLYYIQDNHLSSKGHTVFARCIESDFAAFLSK